jgi:broad specificity phosphatase PhoE
MNHIDRPTQRIFLMRHGHVAAGNGIKRYRGQSDDPLSARGRLQAHGWRDRFAQIQLAAVISSDLCRAEQTARIIAAPHHIECRSDPRLREIDLGAWEGLPIETIQRRYAPAYAQRGRHFASYRVALGESFQELQKRALPAFWQWAALAEQDSILIVSHAGAIRTILCHALQMPLDQLFVIKQNYAALNILDMDHQKRQWTVKAINLSLETNSRILLHPLNRQVIAF